MRIVYTLFIYAYIFSIRVAALVNTKAKLWVIGRKNSFKQLSQKIQELRKDDMQAGIIWFHCASLGEFEQGRPLLEKMKETYPNEKILLTFFSPSGYEVRKNYPLADLIFYLPADTLVNAHKFVQLVQPKKVIFVKYEFWYNYLFVLQQNKIATYFISVIFRPEQYFFKKYGKWALEHLQRVTHFFVQNESSMQLLKSKGINQCTQAGDTRFDRVIKVASENNTIPLLAEFCENTLLFVAGSTWPEDEVLLTEAFKAVRNANLKLKLVLVPHEVTESHLVHIEKLSSNSKHCRYSKLTLSNLGDVEVLIIDSVGLLSSLYRYASICFIGGGFGKGIHNCLEAAVYGKPVLFGPQYSKFDEAKELVNRGGASVVKDSIELSKVILDLCINEQKRHTQGTVCSRFVNENKGAVLKILNALN
ncbi:MAG TPA: glycosyltransferase N-terminal domain-containing protein [Bacteroidia bacterium]|nr:glycosyltransferase N-terminal domain-containing protein [Bacteroidia bacterium]HRH08027.1 glycosyltransferase N-terminal domain-containing protein [Bacteroidia bacterium]